MENVKCPACLSLKNKMFGNKNEYVLRQCESCSTIFSDVIIEKSSDAQQVQEIYDNYYAEEDFAPLLAATKISLQNTVESFEPYRQTKRFLDIGFGAGDQWSIFSPPEQINIWSLKGIRTAFDRAGFTVAAVKREGFNPTEMLLRIKNPRK